MYAFDKRFIPRARARLLLRVFALIATFCGLNTALAAPYNPDWGPWA